MSAALLLPMLVLLAVFSRLDPGARDIATIGVVILLGVPHGALDGEIARPLLRPRFGRGWFVVFAMPYLGLTACVLIAWRMAPLATLIAFLAASVWHFGSEHADGRPLDAVALGGIPIAVPALAHPAATALFLSTASLTGLPDVPFWLTASAWLWCLVALLWVANAALQRDWAGLADSGLTVLLFAALPPLPAFAAYFVCLHAPNHMLALARSGRAPRVRTMRDAFGRAMPVSGLTVLIGAALWRWFPGAPPDRLLSLTIQGLAALTLPHMLLDAAVSSGSSDSNDGGQRAATGCRAR